MTPAARLARRYARLLRLLPAPERRARGDEMLAVLLDGAAPGQTRPRTPEVLDLVLAAVRARLRCLLVTDPVARLGAVAAMVLVASGALVSAVVVERRGLVWSAPVRVVGPVLPRTFPGWDPEPATVSSHPAGPAVMTYVDGNEDREEFVIVVGADGSTLRRLPLPGGLMGASAPLLAPDGRHVAVLEGSVVRIHDLVTGASTSVAVGDPSPVAAALAWSPQGDHLVVRGANSARVLDVHSGGSVVLPGAAQSAAVAPDGRVALARLGRLEVYAASGALVGSQRLPEGCQIAPAGWSADGQVLALSWASDVTDVPCSRAAGSHGVRLPAVSGVPAALGLPAPGVPMAWQGTSLLVSGDAGLQRWDPDSQRSTPVTSVVDHRPREQLRLATTLAAHAGRGPATSPSRGPVPPAAAWVALVLAVLALPAGWLVPHPPGRRLAATPRDLARRADQLAGAWLVAVIGLTPGYLLLTYACGAEMRLLNLATVLLVSGVYVFGRCLRRARNVPDPRLLRVAAPGGRA